MSVPVILIGGGGHARVLLEVLRVCGRKVAGVADHGVDSMSPPWQSVEVLGGDEAILRFQPDQVELVNAIGSVGDATLRRRIFDKHKALGYSFATLVHPSAVIAADVQLGEGAQIMAGVVLQPGTVVGRNSIVNTRASVDHDCSIGEHVHIAPGVTLSGGVRIGEGSHIGTGAVVIQGIEIGRESLVGAGAAVVRDVAQGCRVQGVPARGERA